MKLSERFINAIDEDSIISGKNAHAIEDVVNFIRKYEDAEEQGRLVILPSCEPFKYCCNSTGKVCELATEFGYCKVTVCTKSYSDSLMREET